jgi:hypothetical protein
LFCLVKVPEKLPAMPLLEPLYDGPCSVLARIRDWFCLQVSDRTDTISTSCLKP